MKKFVTVIISFLILFIFLTLNYLLWDKENLLKLRDNDRIEQNWLRGQNLSLQNTVEQLERSMKDLNTQNDSQKDKIVELEQQLSKAFEKENESLKTIQLQKEALNHYKPFIKDKLESVIEKWFADINSSRLEQSISHMDKDFKLWGKSYDIDQYIMFISRIKNIEIIKEPTDGMEPFEILTDQEDPYEVRTRISVLVALQKDLEQEIQEIKKGSNILELVFRYDTDSASWLIKSVSTLASGKP